MNWKQYFFELCNTVAKKSKDPSTKVGCVISTKDNRILSVGFNGFPSGVEDKPERYNDRETKYKFVVHAEANAIVTAARTGIPLQGSVLYVPWTPCHDCAKLIIQAGIDLVYIGGDITTSLDERWKESHGYTYKMFHEAKIEWFFEF